MPAAKVRADHDALRQIAQRFNCNAQTIEQTTQKLKGGLETLRGGDWVGKGAEKFYGEMESSVLPTYKRLSKALGKAASVTLKIDKIMQQAEDDATALFRGGAAGSNGDGAREKDGGSNFPTGAVIGGVIGSGLGVIGAIGGALIGNYVEGLFEGSGPQTDAEVARDLSLRKLYQDTEKDGLTQAQKDAATVAAVRETARQYNIDLSGFREVKYDPSLGPDAIAKDGVLTIGPDAFKSPGYLASTLGHENTHIQQAKDGRLINTNQGRYMNEVEAYNWEINHAKDNALTDGEIAPLTRRRDDFYNRLTPENKKRVDDGNYMPA